MTSAAFPPLKGTGYTRIWPWRCRDVPHTAGLTCVCAGGRKRLSPLCLPFPFSKICLYLFLVWLLSVSFIYTHTHLQLPFSRSRSFSSKKSVHYWNWVIAYESPSLHLCTCTAGRISLTLHTLSRNNPLTPFMAWFFDPGYTVPYCIKFTGIIHWRDNPWHFYTNECRV